MILDSRCRSIHQRPLLIPVAAAKGRLNSDYVYLSVWDMLRSIDCLVQRAMAPVDL